MRLMTLNGIRAVRWRFLLCCLALQAVALTNGLLFAQTEGQSGSVPTAAWGDRLEWDAVVDEWMDGMQQDANADDLTDGLLEDLYETYCHPLNLNALTEADLRQLPFLSSVQILDIMDYVTRHVPVLSTGELMAVTSLDYRTRRLLQALTYAGATAEAQQARWLPQGRSELVARTDVPFYTKMGYADYPPSVLQKNPNKVYRGSPSYHSLRYAYRTRRGDEAGLQLEKDAGERAVDYWSGYALGHDLGRVETLAVGDFQVAWGQGLVANTSAAFGKLMMVGRMGRTDRGFRRHSSMTESGYMRGVAASVRLCDFGAADHTLPGGVFLRLFASHRQADGTYRSDSAGLSSLKTDGLHRTWLERSKRGNVGKTDLGANVRVRMGEVTVSGSVVYSRFSVPLLPVHNTAASRYRLYNATGSTFTNYGLAYEWNGRRTRLAGETAADAGGGMATLNMMQTDIKAGTLTLIQRYYGAKYVSINGKAFGENAEVKNELGLYAGWQHRWTRRTETEMFIDAMHFPWLKYGVDDKSWGIDAMMQLNCASGKGHRTSARYRVKSKQYVGTNQSLRLQHVRAVSSALQLKSSAYATLSKAEGKKAQAGFALSESASWAFPAAGRHAEGHAPAAAKGKLQLTATYFHTDDYASRVYLYEPSLLYTFGFGACFYHGVRGSLLATWPVAHGLDAVVKLSGTRYFNRETIGTGLEQVLHRHREDLQLQLRWRF